MKARLVDLELMVHHATEKAVLVSDNGNRDEAVWLPRSVIELEREPVAGQAQIVTMPERLAIDRELV